MSTVLTPILTYGAKTWVMTTADRSRIHAAKMRSLRAILGRSRKNRIRNKDIRRMVGVCSVLNKIDEVHLRWLGILERMEQGRIAIGCWEWIPGGRRPRGRRRKKWRETAEETLARCALPNIEVLRGDGSFHDRTVWRSMLVALTDI